MWNFFAFFVNGVASATLCWILGLALFLATMMLNDTIQSILEVIILLVPVLMDPYVPVIEQFVEILLSIFSFVYLVLKSALLTASVLLAFLCPIPCLFYYGFTNPDFQPEEQEQEEREEETEEPEETEPQPVTTENLEGPVEEEGGWETVN